MLLAPFLLGRKRDSSIYSGVFLFKSTSIIKYAIVAYEKEVVTRHSYN